MGTGEADLQTALSQGISKPPAQDTTELVKKKEEVAQAAPISSASLEFPSSSRLAAPGIQTSTQKTLRQYHPEAKKSVEDTTKKLEDTKHQLTEANFAPHEKGWKTTETLILSGPPFLPCQASKKVTEAEVGLSIAEQSGYGVHGCTLNCPQFGERRRVSHRAALSGSVSVCVDVYEYGWHTVAPAKY